MIGCRPLRGSRRYLALSQQLFCLGKHRIFLFFGSDATGATSGRARFTFLVLQVPLDKLVDVVFTATKWLQTMILRLFLLLRLIIDNLFVSGGPTASKYAVTLMQVLL